MQLLGQQGRLLLRVEALEEQLSFEGHSHDEDEPEGLSVGATVPAFRLPDLSGRPVALEDYRGRRVLLVFSDPNCDPCNQLTPELVKLHRGVRDDGLAVVMVSRGDPTANQQKCQQQQIQFPVGLQRGWRVSREYGIFSTPVAFLIDEHGVIADKVAVGADEILALATRGRAAGGRPDESLSPALTESEVRAVGSLHWWREDCGHEGVSEMDDRFDNLAKGLAKGMPRRRALRLIAASIGAGALALLPGTAGAAPRTCVTCICGTGQPCNPKSTTCTEVRAFPANEACEAACVRKNQHLCGLGQTFHCPHGCHA